MYIPVVDLSGPDEVWLLWKFAESYEDTDQLYGVYATEEAATKAQRTQQRMPFSGDPDSWVVRKWTVNQ